MHNKTQWCRRPKGTPCPVCGRDSWCTISEDGKTVRCTRAPSDKPAFSKRGEVAWIHEVGLQIPTVQLIRASKPEYKSIKEVTRIVECAYFHEKGGKIREWLSNTLGVSLRSVEAMFVGYGEDSDGKVYSCWPSRDAQGNFVGASRRYLDGTKKTIYGTQAQLYYPVNRSRLRKDLALIVEGGSDPAAAYTIGLYAIGRPSNTGGAAHIKAMGLDCQLLVMGERDEAPEKRGVHSWCSATCQGCSHCYPGLFGAKHTASELGCKYIMPPAGCKDLRDVLAKGKVGELLKLITRT